MTTPEPVYTHVAPSGKLVFVREITKYGQYHMSNGAILPLEVFAKWHKIESETK